MLIKLAVCLPVLRSTYQAIANDGPRGAHCPFPTHGKDFTLVAGGKTEMEKVDV